MFKYKNNKNTLGLVRSLAVSIALLFSCTLCASSTVAFSFDELVGEAELIFVGEVATSDVELNKFNQPVTKVVFKIDQIVKGDYTNNQVVLYFAGGNHESGHLVISDSVIPIQEERGVYFVEGLSARYINPLLGWSQGQFVAYEDQHGLERIYTNRNYAVLGSELPASIISLTSINRRAHSTGKKPLQGLQLSQWPIAEPEELDADQPKALSKQRFLELIRNSLERT